MTSPPAGAPAPGRRHQQVDELCVAAIRALSGQTDVHLRGRVPYRGQHRLPVHAPQLYPAEDDDFGSFRGAADGIALRLRHSDLALHRRLSPAAFVERTLFELLEQFRVESLAGEDLPGVAANVRHRFVQWSLAFHHGGLTETGAGLLLYTVAQVARAQVTGQPVVEQIADLLEDTRGGLAPLLGEDLVGLRRQRGDQRAYALHARAIARAVADMLAEEAPAGSDEEEEEEAEGDRVPVALYVDLPEEPGALPTAAPGRGRAWEDAARGYGVFTTDYDDERRVSTLVRGAQLRSLRERLDAHVAAQGVNLWRLVRQARDLLAEPQAHGWEGGQEEGRIDGRRLTRLVTTPTDRRLFQVERMEAVTDCHVTFLVDCSGSMKEHAQDVATLVDVLGRALEIAGVGTEVLGFTTGAWNGGRAVRDWRRAGRPARPGRLNERLHVVFKDAGTPWRRARRGVAGLLKTDLFREGIDGEAVDWACARLASRPEDRRLLVVVSDGSPMDSATNLANDEHYLDDHLSDVVQRWEEQAAVGVLGLGVGLDLSPYYRRAHALDLSSGTSNATFREVLAFVASGRPTG